MRRIPHGMNRRQLMTRCQRRRCCEPIVEGIRANAHGHQPAAVPAREGAYRDRFRRRFGDDQCRAPNACAAACACLRMAHRIRIGRVLQNAERCGYRHHFVQQLELLGIRLTARLVTPVRLPPGRARLATQAVLDRVDAGLEHDRNGVIAAFAATVAGIADGHDHRRATSRPARRASWSSRSYRPSADRYSNATFWPSTKPVAFSPFWNGARDGNPRPAGNRRKGCRSPASPAAARCAANGHAAAALPNVNMNSRRRRWIAMRL